MTGESIGLLSVASLFFLILIGCPIGLVMIGVGFIGFSLLVGLVPALAVLETSAVDTASNLSFTLVPLFLLMGNFVSRSGMAADLFAASHRLMGGWNGGLAAAGVSASAVFSTVSGSSLATASTMTRVAYPEMAARGYDARLAAGSLAAGGTLGIMIPPSIALLLYALITEQSVGEMFLAGLLPGLLGYGLYLGTVFIMARVWKGHSAPAEQSISKAVFQLLPALGLFGLVMGGLYGEVFTPTEAGGAGAALALVYALARGMGLSGLWGALKETAETSAAIFLILIGAEVFGYVLSTSQLSFTMADFLAGNAFAPWQVLLLIVLFYVVLGCFMESLAMILLTVPIFYPIIIANGFDPVWFGIIAVVTVELGLISPPVGMNLYMVKSAAPELPLGTIMRGVLPFVLADIVRLVILICFPVITLWLTGRL